MSANVYAELADRFGVTVNYVTDMARQGRLPELIQSGGTRSAPAGSQDDVEQAIYERAKRLEQTRQTMPQAQRALADLETHKQRWLREEVYNVQRGRA